MAESLKARVRHAANRILHPLGLHLARREAAFEMVDLLANVSKREPAIATWIDVGASDGIWALRTRRHFPQAKFLLFEALAEHESALANLHQRFGFIPVIAAAGARDGVINFAVDPNLDGSSVANAQSSCSVRSVPLRTVAEAVRQYQLTGPYGLKLDTHGYEIPVLEGAAEILDQVELIVVEAYSFQLTPDCLRFHQLCAWLETRGFRCCDLADPMRRPRDGMLWQMDLAFARADRPEFRDNRYQ